MTIEDFMKSLVVELAKLGDTFQVHHLIAAAERVIASEDDGFVATLTKDATDPTVGAGSADAEHEEPLAPASHDDEDFE